MSKQQDLWSTLRYPTEISDRLIQREKWTRDILQLMMIVVSVAMALIFAGVLFRIFTLVDTLPIYVIFLVIAPAWWGARHGGWRWARFIPFLVCLGMGIFMSIGSTSSPTVGMFFILAVLLAGMLLSLALQRLVAVFSVILYIALSVYFSGNDIIDYLGVIITITFLMIGVVLLQWYYDAQLKKILNEQYQANRAITDEMEKRIFAESSLHDSEAQLRRLAENTTDLVGEINADGLAVYVSPSYFPALGYPTDSLIGTNLFNMVHLDDIQRVMAVVHELVTSKSPRTVQMRIRHANGQYLVFETSGNPLFNAQQELEGFVISSRDITSQKRAEEAQQELEKKYQNIINSLPLGMHMYTLDDDDRLIFTGYNPAADTILGTDHSKLIGKTIEEAFPDLIKQKCPNNIVRLPGMAVPGSMTRSIMPMKKYQALTRCMLFKLHPEIWFPYSPT